MNIFELFGTIAVENGDANKSIEETNGKAKGLAEKLGNGLKTAAKVGVAAIGVASAAIGALVKTSLDQYAEYEQLVGGVDTLFKGSSAKVQRYAANAYKTAGMSANDYMETVTSFSASLLQSLGGDTAAAADVADMAITDMSDNANKMGTDMTMIQNAYQGFAKQNYTMLDNLKLGYGGTQEEMQRLLADAEKFSGVHYDISSLNDVYQAIHVVQTELEITGTTAKEASETISGSIASTKAAWKNLVTSLGKDNADIGQQIDSFISSATTAAKNILPRIQTIIGGIGQLITQMLPVIFAAIPPMLSGILPNLIESAAGLIMSLVEQLPAMLEVLLPIITETAPKIIMTLAEGLLAQIPAIIEAGIQIILALVQGIGEMLPDLIPVIVQAIITIVTTLLSNLDLIIEAGWQLIVGLLEGIFNAIVSLAVQIGGWVYDNLIQPIKDKFNEFVDIGKNIIDKIWEGLKSAWNSVTEWFTGVWDSLFNRDVNVNADANGNISAKGYATGLNYVPYDNFPAYLHRGEAVLTAKEAEGWRSGSDDSKTSKAGITIVQNISAVAQTPVQLASATEAYFEQARWAL